MASLSYGFVSRLLGSLCILVGLVACSGGTETREAQAKLVKTEVVTEEDTYLHFNLSGRAKPVREVNLAFEVPGRIDFLPLNVGDQVKQGKIIARLNDENYRARFEAAKAQHTLAKSEAQRMNKLIARQSISQTQLDEALTQLDVAASNYVLSKKALQDTTLRAPFAGTLAAIYVDNHSFTAASEHIARLVDTSQLEFVVDIPELWIQQYKPGMDFTADIIFDAYPKQQFSARLKELSIEASNKTGTFEATFILDQPQEALIYPGMAGQLHAQVKRKDVDMGVAYSLPLTSIFTLPQETQSQVWLVKEGQLHQQPVSLGRVMGERVEITSGINIGDEVVIAGVNYLKQSQKVSRL